MRKISAILIFIFISRFVSGQTIDVKEITTVKGIDEINRYSFIYDKSGTYIFSPYDTVNKKYTVYSNKGEAVVTDNANYWSTVFDEAGNYYMFMGDNISDTSHNNHFMKNGKIISTYSDITGTLKIKDGIVYFAALEENKYHLYTYNTNNGELKKGKGYEFIYLIYYPPMEGEGEPVGELGFKKDGIPYYMAEENGLKFVVFGDKEEKHYSDIDLYAFETDKNDVLAYFAKDKGKFYEQRGNSFVVQGTREYKKFDYLYFPLMFGKDNSPLYNGVDSINENTSKYHLMSGDREIDITDDYFSSLYFTPSGKLAYVKTEKGKNNKSKSYVVIDGKKSKSFESVNLIGFTANDVPVYVVSKDENSQVLMQGDKIISKAYNYIMGIKILSDGKIAYVGNNFEDKDKNKEAEFYVFIGDKSFGPFEELGTINYSMEDYVLFKNGVHVFIESKIIDRKDYITEKTIHSNNWENGKFDWVNFASIYSGKVIYLATSIIPGKDIKKDALYVEDKKVSEDYDLIMNNVFDEKAGKLEFIGIKGSTFYYVKVQF